MQGLEMFSHAIELLSVSEKGIRNRGTLRKKDSDADIGYGWLAFRN